MNIISTGRKAENITCPKYTCTMVQPSNPSIQEESLDYVDYHKITTDCTCKKVLNRAAWAITALTVKTCLEQRQLSNQSKIIKFKECRKYF